MINLSRALRYPFSGPNVAGKTLAGAFMTLMVPFGFITGLMLLGYQLRIMRDVIDGRDDELPDWHHLGSDLVQGLVVFLGSLVYYVPVFILMGVSAAALWDILVDIRGSINLLEPRPFEFEFDRAKLSLIVVSFSLALIWLLLSAPMLLAATAKYAETGEFSAFTHILQCADEVWDQRGAAAQLTLSLFLLAILFQIISMLVSVTCMVGTYIQFIQFAAISHLGGQWGAVLKANRPRPNVIRPIKPPTR
ncbi:MAG: DUF4013 domain-containing protein [Anaerolineae bacterium]|nr:DUF4013 domain-containing protein [Anaerolineae bacterium]